MIGLAYSESKECKCKWKFNNENHLEINCLNLNYKVRDKRSIQKLVDQNFNLQRSEKCPRCNQYIEIKIEKSLTHMSNNIVLELERNNYSRNLNKMVKFTDRI